MDWTWLAISILGTLQGATIGMFAFWRLTLYSFERHGLVVVRKEQLDAIQGMIEDVHTSPQLPTEEYRR
jgi:hypothetical protein